MPIFIVNSAGQEWRIEARSVEGIYKPLLELWSKDLPVFLSEATSLALEESGKKHHRTWYILSHNLLMKLGLHYFYTANKKGCNLRTNHPKVNEYEKSEEREIILEQTQSAITVDTSKVSKIKQPSNLYLCQNEISNFKEFLEQKGYTVDLDIPAKHGRGIKVDLEAKRDQTIIKFCSSPNSKHGPSARGEKRERLLGNELLYTFRQSQQI